MNTGGNQSNNEAPPKRATELYDVRLPSTACDNEKRAEENASKLPPKETEQEDQVVKKTEIIAKMKTEDGGSPKVFAEGSSGPDAFSAYSSTNVRMMHLLWYR